MTVADEPGESQHLIKTEGFMMKYYIIQKQYMHLHILLYMHIFCVKVSSWF